MEKEQEKLEIMATNITLRLSEYLHAVRKKTKNGRINNPLIEAQLTHWKEMLKSMDFEYGFS